jgi:IclR family transcriptional regulator, KDG regulon repressor
MPGGRPKSRTRPDAVKSVAKVLDILEHLGAARRPVSVSDLARATGFNVSTAFRLVQTLVVRGYAEQQAGHRSYVLGPRVYQVASAYIKGNDLATLARPHLEALRDVLGETVDLVILSQGEIVQLCKADGQHVVSASIRSSEREPAYCTATGKVLLAGLETEAFKSYLAGVSFHAYTAQTITSRAKLEREIAAVREEGYALDVEEYAENLCCVSVPVRDPASGAIAAAVSVAMPKLRFKRSLVPRWRKLLGEKAALISPQLGLIDA